MGGCYTQCWLFYNCFLWETLILGTSVSCDVVITQFGHQNTDDPPVGLGYSHSVSNVAT